MDIRQAWEKGLSESKLFNPASAVYCTRRFNNLSLYTIIPKSIIPYLQTVAVFQFNVSFTMYTVTHSCLAKNTPSQNPPSSVNPHIFSNHRFLIGRYPYHQSKQQGKKELCHILCATHYKCHRFLPHVSIERCSCDVT